MIIHLSVKGFTDAPDAQRPTVRIDGSNSERRYAANFRPLSAHRLYSRSSTILAIRAPGVPATNWEHENIAGTWCEGARQRRPLVLLGFTLVINTHLFRVGRRIQSHERLLRLALKGQKIHLMRARARIVLSLRAAIAIKAGHCAAITGRFLRHLLIRQIIRPVTEFVHGLVGRFAVVGIINSDGPAPVIAFIVGGKGRLTVPMTGYKPSRAATRGHEEETEGE